MTRKSAARFLVVDTPPLAASLMLAEAFFKFGSFLLEALAFLALWQAFRLPYERAYGAVRAALSRRRASASSAEASSRPT